MQHAPPDAQSLMSLMLEQASAGVQRRIHHPCCRQSAHRTFCRGYSKGAVTTCQERPRRMSAAEGLKEPFVNRVGSSDHWSELTIFIFCQPSVQVSCHRFAHRFLLLGPCRQGFGWHPCDTDGHQTCLIAFQSQVRWMARSPEEKGLKLINRLVTTCERDVACLASRASNYVVNLIELQRHSTS